MIGTSITNDVTEQQFTVVPDAGGCYRPEWAEIVSEIFMIGSACALVAFVILSSVAFYRSARKRPIGRIYQWTAISGLAFVVCLVTFILTYAISPTTCLG